MSAQQKTPEQILSLANERGEIGYAHPRLGETPFTDFESLKACEARGWIVYERDASFRNFGNDSMAIFDFPYPA